MVSLICGIEKKRSDRGYQRQGGGGAGEGRGPKDGNCSPEVSSTTDGCTAVPTAGAAAGRAGKAPRGSAKGSPPMEHVHFLFPFFSLSFFLCPHEKRHVTEPLVTISQYLEPNRHAVRPQLHGDVCQLFIIKTGKNESRYLCQGPQPRPIRLGSGRSTGGLKGPPGCPCGPG